MKPLARVGRFEVDHLVGALDDYERYRAWDPEEGKHVSLLVVRDRRRFARIDEATQKVAAIGHPRFATRVGGGATEDGRGFVAFEWADGVTLLDRLRDGPLGVPETEELAFALVEALGALHDAGVSHGAVVPKNVFLVDAIASRAKLFGVGEDPPDDPAGDALGLAKLVVGCNAMSARKGSARGRGWGLVAELEPALGRFIRESLGEWGQRADRRASLEALGALRRTIASGEAAPRSRKVAAVAVAVSAVLVARHERADAEPGERPAPSQERLVELASGHGVTCSIYADGTLSAAPPSDALLAPQVEALLTVALAWREAFAPFPMVVAASSSAEPDTEEPYLRGLEILEKTADGEIALDELAAVSASATFSLSRRGEHARVLRRRPEWLTSQTTMGGVAATIVLVLLAMMFGRRLI